MTIRIQKEEPQAKPCCALGYACRRKHNMSAEARKRLSERMRKRWDDYRKNKAKASKGK